MSYPAMYTRIAIIVWLLCSICINSSDCYVSNYKLTKTSHILRHNRTIKERNCKILNTRHEKSTHQHENSIVSQQPAKRKGIEYYTTEILAGLVVALATIPSSISYATVIGVSPVLGIWNTAIVGFITTLIGGSTGIINGSTAVCAAPLARLNSTLGRKYMTLSLLWTSILEVLFGYFKLSRFADIVTEPVIIGFLNGLGAFIFRSQMKIFYGVSGKLLEGYALQSAVSISGLSAAIIFIMSHWKVSLLKVPPQLVSILITSVLAIISKMPVKTVADIAGKAVFTGGWHALPVYLGVPQVRLDVHTTWVILSTAVSMAMICIVETLLAQKISGDAFRYALPEYAQRPDEPDKAVIGLGVGTFVASLYGGIGACGLIPNTLLNGSCGGSGVLSNYSVAIFMALAVVLFSPFLGVIPVASLAGLMFTVAVRTIEWRASYSILQRTFESPQKVVDTIAMFVSGYLCYSLDMGLGIFVGVLIAQSLRIANQLKILTSTRLKSNPL